MLDGLKKKIATKIAGTSWGKEALKKQIESMPIPPQAKQMFLKVIESEKGMEILQKIAEETEALMKAGKNQMAASQSVMMKYQNELRDAMQGK